MTEEIVEAAPAVPVEPVAVSPDAPPAVPPAAASEPAEPEGPMAARFAALAKRDKELTLREKAAKEAVAAKEAALEAKAAELAERATKLGSLDELLALAKSKPTEFLQRTGLTYAQLTDAVLNEGQPPTADDRVAKLEAELAADRAARAAEVEKAKADAEASAKAAHERAIENFKVHIGEFVKTNAETYELVAAEEATDLVFDVVEAYFQEHKQVLPVEQAAAKVEAYLEAEARKKYAGSKKLAGLFQPPPPPPAATLGAALAAPAAAKAKPSPTLTSKTGASGVASPPTEPARALTPYEIAAKYKRAAKARNAGA